MLKLTARKVLFVVVASLLCGLGSTEGWGVTFRFTQLPPAAIKKDLDSFKLENSKRAKELYKMFQQAGCAPSEITEQHIRWHPPNVVCTLPGRSKSEIIVSAHTDNADMGTGIVDDWSGVALLAALVQSLRTVPRRHTFVFIGFSDEQGGLVGSHYYVKHLSRAQVSEILAEVNLECLGLTPTKVWPDRADPRLLVALETIAKLHHLKLFGVNIDKFGFDDDTQPFVDRHIPVITITSLTPKTLSILHTLRDNPSAIHFDDYCNSYRLIAAYLAYLDSGLP